MKVEITLIETEIVKIVKKRKSVIVDTEQTPIFKGKPTPHHVQDVLYYEYLDPDVKKFLDMLDQQPIETVERFPESELPEIEVTELEKQISLNSDYEKETFSPYEDT